MDNAVAIVGMSCRFAGCPNVGSFWDAVMTRRSLLTVPGMEAELPVGQRGVFGRPYPQRIGELKNLYACVPSVQNFPRQVNAGENQDLYFATQLAFDALADAAMKPHSHEPVRGSVRFGYAPPFNSSTVNWLQHTTFLDQTMDIIRRFMPSATEDQLADVRARLVESLPAPDAASFLLGTGYRFASWIARECAFSGTATVEDAGIVTGAAVLADAIGDLLSGRVDVALAGTLTPPLNRAYLEGLAGEIQFSARNELTPFSSDPDGTLPGEGGVFFVLKRRADALKAHDRIYALVRNVGIGHNPEDDASQLFRHVAERAGIDVRTVGLVEADGSGIGAQEAREIDALQRIWGEHRPGLPLVGVGSVKGNVGHTLRSAMAAGVVKTALALSRRVLPPQVAPQQVVDRLSNLSSSAYLLTEARPWITGDSANPRRAAVLGSNFDAVNPVGGASVAGRAAVILLEEEPENRR